MRQNFVTQFTELLKHWLCNIQVGGIVEKKRALSVDQCWLQALKLSVHLIKLLSILLRCNYFTKIQKAVVGQTGSRPPKSEHDFFLVQAWLWEVLWSFLSVQSLSWSSTGGFMESTFRLMSHSNQEIIHCCCIE